MTLAELGQRMSNTEFEIWMAEELQRSYECPSCGHEARDMVEYMTVPVKCPICKHEYERVRNIEQWRSLEQATHSEASPVLTP